MCLECSWPGRPERAVYEPVESETKSAMETQKGGDARNIEHLREAERSVQSQPRRETARATSTGKATAAELPKPSEVPLSQLQLAPRAGQRGKGLTWVSVLL